MLLHLFFLIYEYENILPGYRRCSADIMLVMCNIQWMIKETRNGNRLVLTKVRFLWHEWSYLEAVMVQRHFQSVMRVLHTGSWKWATFSVAKIKSVLLGSKTHRHKIPTAWTVMPFLDTFGIYGSAVSMDWKVIEVLHCCSYHARALCHIQPLLINDIFINGNWNCK